jgi:hypothetical protein
MIINVTDLRPERQSQSADNAFNTQRRGFDFSSRHVPNNFAPAIEASVSSGFTFGCPPTNQKDPGSAGSTGSGGNPFVFGSQEKGKEHKNILSFIFYHSLKIV